MKSLLLTAALTMFSHSAFAATPDICDGLNTVETIRHTLTAENQYDRNAETYELSLRLPKSSTQFGVRSGVPYFKDLAVDFDPRQLTVSRSDSTKGYVWDCKAKPGACAAISMNADALLLIALRNSTSKAAADAIRCAQSRNVVFRELMLQPEPMSHSCDGVTVLPEVWRDADVSSHAIYRNALIEMGVKKILAVENIPRVAYGKRRLGESPYSKLTLKYSTPDSLWCAMALARNLKLWNYDIQSVEPEPFDRFSRVVIYVPPPEGVPADNF